jgi:hypothetical protein
MMTIMRMRSAILTIAYSIYAVSARLTIIEGHGKLYAIREYRFTINYHHLQKWRGAR